MSAVIDCKKSPCSRDNGGHCRLKPRCRWVIFDTRTGHRLEPYRIKVELVCNARIDGKVKQEVVAFLGTIDATWLESFWATAPDPNLRTRYWELRSLRERTAFWQGVLERMSRIGDNRLDKDERVAIRRAIHKVVPWVMEAERKRLDVLGWQHAYDRQKDWHNTCERDIARDKKEIEEYSEKLRKDEKASADAAGKLLQIGLQIAKLNQDGS